VILSSNFHIDPILKFQDLVNHSLCLTNITATKQDIMIKDMIKIVNGLALFMSHWQWPFGFVAFIEIRTETSMKERKAQHNEKKKDCFDFYHFAHEANKNVPKQIRHGHIHFPVATVLSSSH
jgi:hypothetical protein